MRRLLALVDAEMSGGGEKARLFEPKASFEPPPERIGAKHQGAWPVIFFFASFLLCSDKEEMKYPPVYTGKKKYDFARSAIPAQLPIIVP